MIALIQRVAEAHVDVAGERIAAIGPGLLALVGVERADGRDQARRLAERVLAYRVFPDEGGRMNLDVRARGGALLAVPQFTLAADTRKGNRPGFSGAAEPGAGERLFDAFCGHCGELGLIPARGRFGAHMDVGLVNEGPVTFWLRVEPAS